MSHFHVFCDTLKVTPAGIITTIVGKAYGWNGDNIAATAALLRGASGVAITDKGDIFLADTGNQRIRIVRIPMSFLQ